MRKISIIILIGLISSNFYKNYSYEKVNPIDINKEGLGLLEKLQGHWVGTNEVLGMKFPWFSFDYRAISPSHIHGIFEGGTSGNLLTSFFVTNFKGKRTIMARNGGVLNGIYRSSYFVLDRVEHSKDEDYYRLVDAIGGEKLMYMELMFKKEELVWNVYTSQLGADSKPSKHMEFKAKRNSVLLAQKAAEQVGFPQNKIAFDLSKGFNTTQLYGNLERKTATFLSKSSHLDVYDLAKKAQDVITIADYPFLSTLHMKLIKNPAHKKVKTFIYLSSEPLADKVGFKSMEAFNSVLLFPELNPTVSEFRFTYLHPGDYFITIISDTDENGEVSMNDIVLPSQLITILPEENKEMVIAVEKGVVQKEHINDFIKPISFEEDVEVIIQNMCLFCHSGDLPSGGLDLSTKENIKKAIEENGLLYRINNMDNPMPPEGLLDGEYRTTIENWQKTGFND
ncbi:hypothetical protein UJ101_01630 [Flavobacteriaceae bacterium UJ101]|nr:hypothetical protein UJ101_01630 [Flavobacteriaceae bacterium UJ101]